jgi:hypothetical protein
LSCRGVGEPSIAFTVLADGGSGRLDKESVMHRRAALLLCALLTAAAVAAPAPFPRTSRKAGPWFDGWDSPVNPKGDCRFNRQGGKLLLSVPGKGHRLDVATNRIDAPRLLREVEEDFVAQVRVGGVLRPQQSKGSHSAGLFLPLGRGFVTLNRVAVRSDDEEKSFYFIGMSYPTVASSSSLRCPAFYPADDKPAYLRLERRKDWLRLLVSQDGKRWQRLKDFSFLGYRVPRKLKIGVVAATTADEPFTPWFDEFKLTPLGKTQ